MNEIDGRDLHDFAAALKELVRIAKRLAPDPAKPTAPTLTPEELRERARKNVTLIPRGQPEPAWDGRGLPPAGGTTRNPSGSGRRSKSRLFTHPCPEKPFLVRWYHRKGDPMDTRIAGRMGGMIGGKIGGKSRSKAKMAASMKNLKKAQRARWAGHKKGK